MKLITQLLITRSKQYDHIFKLIGSSFTCQVVVASGECLGCRDCVAEAVGPSECMPYRVVNLIFPESFRKY